MEKNEFKVKTTVDMNTAKAILDDLAKSGSSFAMLKPGGQIGLEIKAVKKKGKEKLAVKLSWRQPGCFGQFHALRGRAS